MTHRRSRKASDHIGPLSLSSRELLIVPRVGRSKPQRMVTRFSSAVITGAASVRRVSLGSEAWSKAAASRREFFKGFLLTRRPIS